MNMGFLLNYLLIPILFILFIFLNHNKRTQANLLLFKGIYYFYLAISLLINYIKTDVAVREVLGFTMALAIMEGAYAMRDGMEKMKEAIHAERNKI